jgi:hypothetical protein
MLYRLEPILLSPYAIIDMEKFNKKYYEYFIQNTGDGKFLNYVTIEFKAQEDYNQNNIIKEDFLNCSTPIPVFSERFVNCLKNDLIAEMDFIKCSVKCDEKIFEYYIGNIKKSKKLVDKENSEYRELRDGSKVIHCIKYHKNINHPAASGGGWLFPIGIGLYRGFNTSVIQQYGRIKNRPKGRDWSQFCFRKIAARPCSLGIKPACRNKGR